MSVRSRLVSLERRASPTGECGCNGTGFSDMLLCRDASVPPPPRKLCPRCGRMLPRLILGPVARKPADPAYEPADADTIRRMAYGAYEPADTGTVLRMMAEEEP